ncbi:MAG: DUF5723 family protein [Balneolaceae bacterium]
MAGIPAISFAQISLSPENMGLGGGGTSYSTGYEALFINPANLHIRERDYRVQFGFAQVGAQYTAPLFISHELDRLNTFSRGLKGFNPEINQISDEQRESIISRNFDDEASSADFLSQGEIYWFGIKWISDERSYAIALRSRFASRFTVGRGFYDPVPVETNGQQILDNSLTHNYQSLHELSFGYSDTFSLLSGIFPQMSEFVIGLAPKIVVSGASLSVNHTDRIERETNGEIWTRSTDFSHQSSGAYSVAAEGFMNRGVADTETLSAFDNNNLFRPTGIGVGIDFGLTYLITFGDDFSQIRRTDETTDKSLRLSFSVTDLGAIHYFDDLLTVSVPPEEQPAFLSAQPSDSYFSGTPGQYLFFLDQEENHPLRSVESRKRGVYQKMLPTALNAGTLIQFDRLKVMGDFRLGLNNDAFITPKFASYLGMELRPLSFLPLRAGMRIATDSMDYFTLGAGINTRYFDINSGVKLRTDTDDAPLEVAAASFVALKFYIP